MRVRLGVAALVNSIFINLQANMATAARRRNNGIFLTNRKLPPIHSELIPRSRSKASTYSSAEKGTISLTYLYRIHVVANTLHI